MSVAVRNIGNLALEVVDLGLETITLPPLDGEEVVIVLLGFSVRGILGEKCQSLPQSCGESATAGSRINTKPHFSGWTENVTHMSGLL